MKMKQPMNQSLNLRKKSDVTKALKTRVEISLNIIDTALMSVDSLWKFSSLSF